jgi:pSer/pThr/pTyr-binding forkhead associated (FHA) protein
VTERRDPDSRPNNDVYLSEKDELMNISREHFQIDRHGETFVLEDRRSTCGTIVEGEVVGGQHAGGRVQLQDGDVIIAGSSHSPFVFKFRIR